MKLLFATRNRGKLRELGELLALPGVALVSLEDVPPFPETEETGSTFSENAVAKAREAARFTGLPSLADDSGLEVDALGGAPGVRSARFAGPGATDAQRNALLLEKLAGVETTRRTARFRCALAFVDPASPDAPLVTEGVCEGRILDAPRGKGGFGYDPLFFVESLGQTFAEATAEQKHALSHRGRAMRAMGELLRARLGR